MHVCGSRATPCVTRGDRFILRSYSPSLTIGGGRVLDPTPGRTPIRTAAGAARFRKLDAGARDATVAFVEERGSSGLSVVELGRRLGESTATTQALAAELSSAQTDRDDWRHAGERAGRGRRARQALGGRRGASSDLSAVGRVTARGSTRARARGRIVGACSTMCSRALVDEGKLVARDRLALPGQRPTLTSEERDAQAALERVFREAGLAPPDLAAAARHRGRLACRGRSRVRPAAAPGRARQGGYAAVSQRGARAAQAGGNAPRRGTAAPPAWTWPAFKARYGITRKYAIPLLEWLDRERVTRRVGNARVVL